MLIRLWGNIVLHPVPFPDYSSLGMGLGNIALYLPWYKARGLVVESIFTHTHTWVGVHLVGHLSQTVLSLAWPALCTDETSCGPTQKNYTNTSQRMLQLPHLMRNGNI